MFKAGKKEGNGKYFSKSTKEVIEGEWLNDCKEGKARIHNANGRIRIVDFHPRR
jgi:hypothetical protein